MKESRYIELLNLYLDHQLTPPESAELEAEVINNPARRQIYGQYCRMQKGCTLLFEAERSLAPKTAAAVMAIKGEHPKTTYFPGWAGFGSRGMRVAGFAAAAACVVFVVAKIVPRAGSPVVSSPAVVATLPASAVGDANGQSANTPSVGGLREGELIVAIPGIVDVSAPRSAFHSVFIANSSLRATRAFEAEPAGRPHPAGLEWLDRVTLPTLRSPRAEDLAFEPVPLKLPETRAFSGRRPFAGQAEMTAFQFQR